MIDGLLHSMRGEDIDILMGLTNTISLSLLMHACIHVQWIPCR